MANGKKVMRCAFCGKTQDEVDRMLIGPNIYICNECVELCYDLLREDGVVPAHDNHNHGRHESEGPKHLPKPKEIKEFFFL